MESPWVNIRDMKHIDLPYVLRNELAAYPHPWKEGHFRTSLNGGFTSRRDLTKWVFAGIIILMHLEERMRF